jgi:CRP-like cAMP-binding protein
MSEIEWSGAILEFVRHNEMGARQLHFHDGQTIFRQNDPTADFFIVESGEIRLFEVAAHGARRLLDILGCDRSFGFAALEKSPVYGRLAISVGDSVVRAIPADGLREILLSHSELAMPLIESMAREIHHAWTEGSHFIFEDCRLRLIRTLLRFSNSPAARVVPEGIELHMTHAELAQAVGVARETVSLCLMQLRNENLVRTSRNRVIFDRERLQRIDPQPEFNRELAIAG